MMNVKTFISFDRMDEGSDGRKIPIYKRSEMFLSKEEVLEARKHREEMKLKVSSSWKY